MVGLLARLADRRDSRRGNALKSPGPMGSGFFAFGQMRIPGVPGFRLHMGKTGAGRRIGDADEVLASRTLNLPPGVARITLQRLIAVGTVEFEFSGAHRVHPNMRKTAAKSIKKNKLYFLITDCACRSG